MLLEGPGKMLAGGKLQTLRDLRKGHMTPADLPSGFRQTQPLKVIGRGLPGFALDPFAEDRRADPADSGGFIHTVTLSDPVSHISRRPAGEIPAVDPVPAGGKESCAVHHDERKQVADFRLLPRAPGRSRQGFHY